MSLKLIKHLFSVEAKKILSEGDWAFETVSFHIEHSGIEWRCHSNDGISFVVAIYEKEGVGFIVVLPMGSVVPLASTFNLAWS